MYTTPYTGNEEQLAGLLGTYLACIGFFALLMIAFYIFLFWRILTKAGYSGWLSLLNLVGGIGTLVLLGILAFGDWPALKRGGYGGPPSATTYPPPGPQPDYRPTPPAYVPPAVPGPPTYTPPTQQPPRAEEPSYPVPEAPAPPVAENPPSPPMEPSE